MRVPVTPKEWKQPVEAITIEFDFEGTSPETRKLKDGDSVSGIGTVEAATGITASAPQRTGNSIFVMLTGGTVDNTYRVRSIVTTTDGETLALVVDIEVLDGAN